MKHILSINELSTDEILEIIKLGIKLKREPGKFRNIMNNKTLAMIFQKTSTRTRCSFEAGMTRLGGHAIYLDWRTTNFTLGSIGDEVKCLARYCDLIMARVYKQGDVEAMASASDVPVINGLSDRYHPCQVLADLMTIYEKKGKLNGLTLAYVGDGNNVCNTLLLGCTKVGMNVNVACPKGYEPDNDVVKTAKKQGSVMITHDPKMAVKNADVVYTDTWVSIGREAETEKRKKVFPPYQVNRKLLGDSRAIIMHCLPAHRGYEITDDVLDSRNSVVFDQAENRMHSQNALMIRLLG